MITCSFPRTFVYSHAFFVISTSVHRFCALCDVAIAESSPLAPTTPHPLPIDEIFSVYCSGGNEMKVLTGECMYLLGASSHYYFAGAAL